MDNFDGSMDQRACLGLEELMMDPSAVDEAALVCAACPLLEACLVWGEENKDTVVGTVGGVWRAGSRGDRPFSDGAVGEILGPKYRGAGCATCSGPVSEGGVFCCKGCAREYVGC